jgi:O-antigen ligase
MAIDSPKSTGKTRISLRCIFVILLLAAAHSQVTLRHWALRAVGVQYGKVETVAPVAGATQSVAHDPFANFATGELAGKKVDFGGETFTVVTNDRTSLTLDATAERVAAVVEQHPEYLTGFTRKTQAVRTALRVPAVGFTPADLLLALALPVMVVDLLRRRNWRALLPPLPVVALLVVGAVSLVDKLRLLDGSYTQVDVRGGIKELIQYGEVLVGGWLFFSWALERARARRAALATLVAMCVVCVVAALIEYTQMTNSVQGIDGIFGIAYNPTRSSSTGSESSRNLLALYLAIMAPLLVGLVGAASAWWQRGLLALVLIGAFAATLSLWLLVCAVLGCALVAGCSGRRWAIPLLFLGSLAAMFAIGRVAPRHGEILTDSAALYRNADTYGMLPQPMTNKDANSAAIWTPWQQKYVELQAAMNALSYSPLFGYGLGSYQVRINAFYDSAKIEAHAINKDPVNFMERDAHGWYKVQAVETGLIGVLCVIWLLGQALADTLRARRNAGRRDAWILAGIAGAVLVMLLASTFGNVMTRGLQFIAVALLAWPKQTREVEST